MIAALLWHISWFNFAIVEFFWHVRNVYANKIFLSADLIQCSSVFNTIIRKSLVYTNDFFIVWYLKIEFLHALIVDVTLLKIYNVFRISIFRNSALFTKTGNECWNLKVFLKSVLFSETEKNTENQNFLIRNFFSGN